MKKPLRGVSLGGQDGQGSGARVTYRENGSWNVLWKWFNGPWPLPNPGAVEMAG